MLSDDADLTDQIYEAAVLPDFWPGLLGRIARRATCGDGIIFSAQGTDVRLVASSPQYERDAMTFFSLYPDSIRTRRLITSQRAGFLSDFDEFSFEERETLPVFRDYLIPLGYGDGVATAIPMPTGEMVVVHFEGSYRREPFSRAVIDWLDSIRPHLARSALLSARLAFERARSAVATLAALGLAACVVRPSGAVMLANRQFEEAASVWTTRGGERIALLDRRADAMLAETLRQVDTAGDVRSIPIRGTAERGPAILHVVPVRRSAHDLFGRACAILVLSNPSDAPTVQTPLLQALFDLSPTEAALAARIAAGHTVERIALDEAKSVHTVRNQLKNVLAKTGCARQADLARLLAQLAGPGTPPPPG